MPVPPTAPPSEPHRPDPPSPTTSPSARADGGPLGGVRDSPVAVGVGDPRVYSPDGETLLLLGLDDELLALPTTGGGAPRALDAPGVQRGIRFSPDGRWVSYHMDGVGGQEAWVASYPSFQNRRQVSADGGMHARWRGGGEELYFLDDDGWVMAATVIPGATPAFEAPVPLFQGPPTPPFHADAFSVTADGRRFLLREFVDGEDDRGWKFVVSNNWTRALGRE